MSIRVDVWSDFVWPFCFVAGAQPYDILKQVVEKVLEEEGDQAESTT